MRTSHTENRKKSYHSEGKARFTPPLFTFVNKLLSNDLYIFISIFIAHVFFCRQRYENTSEKASLFDFFQTAA